VEGREARVAENKVTFRRSNEQIEEVAADLENSLTVRLIPFLCECADRRCTHTIRLLLKEYKEVRDYPRRFAVAPGHELMLEDEHVISRNSRFAIVEKLGESGRVAAESDPRSRSDPR